MQLLPAALYIGDFAIKGSSPQLSVNFSSNHGAAKSVAAQLRDHALAAAALIHGAIPCAVPPGTGSAAFARSEPLSLASSGVLTTPAGANSLLLDSARFISQRPARRNSNGGSVKEEDTVKAAAAISATYEMLLQRLYQVNRFSAVKLGLENMQKLNAAFGDPASQFEIVHVAGTNGKGSVAFKVAKALERSGHKTGLFVSPHVACFRERVQVNGQLISESDVCDALSEIFNISAQLRIPATFFEITTMLAFMHFAKQGVDCVVLETGLGGRLDSTNIVTPALSVITSIGLDHTRILGNTREAIAREKAGIIKPNVPVVVGPNTPENVMMEFAARNNAPLVRVPLQADFNEDYNAENTAIAREACVQLNTLHGLQIGRARGAKKLCVNLTNERVNAALESRPLVLDVAHNPQAIDKLVELLHKQFPDKKLRFVCGFSADKAINKVLDKITNVVRDTHPDESDEELQERIHLVKANHPRGASLEEINLALANATAEGEMPRVYETISTIKDGVNAALAASRASSDDEVVVVCGSVFLMAEARQALGLKEPIDSTALNAVAGLHLSTPESRLAATEQEAEVAAATPTLFMSEYKKTVTASGAALLSELPRRVAQVHALVEQHAGERAPSKLRAKFAQSVLAAPAAVSSNGDVQALLTVVGDEVAQLMSAIQQLQLWIQLQVPKVEDGNNFGVEVQKYAYVHLKEALEKWQKTWDSLADYSSARATAVEKLNAKASSETSTTTTVTSSKGGKDGDEEKSVTAKVEKQSNAGNKAPEDAIAAVVEIDVKCDEWLVVMSSAPSPRKPNAGNESTLRLHPRGPPPLHMSHATPQSIALAGYPNVAVRHRSRMSPRQVKLQRMEPSPPYTIASPLRDQISTNFRHELFQFHQLLRDAIEAKHPDKLQHSDSQWSAVISRDRCGEAGGASNPKDFFRYVDSLKSLRDLLVALLFKRPTRDANDPIEDNYDEDGAYGLQSSFGLGFGLNFNAGKESSSPRSARQPPSTYRSKDRVPFYLYCQQLEDELEALRRRVPHRRPRSPGVVAGALGDIGLLQDNTVMLLLDFWGLPHEERLAFFCQIASQANEQEASAILHVFLDNCTTQTFMQIWEALQQSPQFQKMIREAKLQLEPATVDGRVIPTKDTAESEKEKAAPLIEPTDVEKPLVWRGSQRGVRKRGRRSTRFVDLSGITEAFDFKENGGDSSDENDDDFKESLGDSKHDKHRFQKFTIRERGRLSLSDPSDHPDEENKSGRRSSFRRSDHSRRRLKTPVERESVPLLELLHNDLTEIIKMEDGPGVYVMDAVWQLLEALDGQGKHASKSGYHRRHVPLPAPVAVKPVQPLQPQQEVVTQNPRGSIRAPLSVEQQFLMKLDQLQSMLVALGDARVHTMSTETITGAYRRMPILAKLFAALADTSLGAAGVDTTGGAMTKIVSNCGTTQHLTSSWQAGRLDEKSVDPLDAHATTAGDNVREDVEAMGLLLGKLSKFVRSLAPLVDNEDAAPSNVSASDDVLTIMDLATKLENAGALVEAPAGGGGGKRRLSLAADRELPILLAVQSLARSNNFDLVSQLIGSAVKAKMARVRLAAAEAKANDEDESDGDETVATEGDEEAMRIVTNLRRPSTKAAPMHEAKDQMHEQMQSGGGQNAAGESDATFVAALRAGKGDIPINTKSAAALRGVKLFNVDILLRIVNQGMVSTLQYGNRRMEFSEFIYDWHIRNRWSLGTFLGGSKHRIELPKRQFKIRITFAISTVQEALRERFGVYARGMDVLAERIRAKACPRDDEFIRESDLLTLCVEEFVSQRALLEKVLGAVYQAGDINGDGSLEFDEFASVVTHLSPTVDDRFLQKVFEAAHDFSKPHRISFARFLDVILLERVLSPAPLSAAATGIARAKNAAAAAAASTAGLTSPAASVSSNSSSKAATQDEQEEAYQFELLRETWAHDREAVTQVLETSITHAPTAKSLTFRVAFLDQLLDRRVDAKTAWLCHRQIMREIARYQHLDADQIAGLLRKELQFKKTVRAIQNVQRLSALFAVNPALRGPNEDEAAVDAPEAPSYTAVVQQSLDAQVTGMPDVADVAALENELRETFLERADGDAIDDYMAALQHIRRVSIKQQSLQLQFDEMTVPRIEESLPEGNERSDTDDDDDDESKEDEAEYDREEVGPS
ncbi:EF-Hand 1, calcium-binding site [Phytophthora cactorum]|nr:EF-Hand 1, calcium-binding site [Phytophthora cactorum]